MVHVIQVVASSTLFILNKQYTTQNNDTLSR